MRIEPTPFSVRELIYSVETMFLEKIKEKGLHFTTQVEEAVPDTLNGDATRLTQVLVNLIGNAAKFTQQGRIEVDINNEGIKDNTISLGITVSDTGIGIDNDKLPGIFERFQASRRFHHPQIWRYWAGAFYCKRPGRTAGRFYASDERAR